MDIQNFNEAVPVSIADLDPKLKAIVRIKIREFIHLTPGLEHIPIARISGDLSLALKQTGSRSEFGIDNLSYPGLSAKSDFLKPCTNRPSRSIVRGRRQKIVSN